jgi:uncharacterized Fe-S center protein
VAVDQAALDLINNGVPLPDSLAAEQDVEEGERVLPKALGVDGQLHVDAAEQIGLGSKAYGLSEV